NGELIIASQGLDATWAPTAHVLQYSDSGGGVDLSDGLVDSEGLSQVSIPAMLVGDGAIWFAYADESGKPHVKRRDGPSSGWSSVGPDSLDTYGLVNSMPDIE